MTATRTGTYITNISTLDLDARPARSTAIPHDLAEAAQQVWTDDRGARVGVWDCQPGQFTLHCQGYTEICHLITGIVVIEEHGGTPITLGPGDALVMPSGWRGVWRVEEYVKKLYVILDDMPGTAPVGR